MNTYPVEEATQRHCPNKFALEGLTVLAVAQGSGISYLSPFCIADRCMAWRWNDPFDGTSCSIKSRSERDCPDVKNCTHCEHFRGLGY